jgi:hypothetical protein
LDVGFSFSCSAFSSLLPLLFLVAETDRFPPRLLSSYPLYVNVWNKEVMDVHRDTMYGIEGPTNEEHKMESQASSRANENRDATTPETRPDVQA